MRSSRIKNFRPGNVPECWLAEAGKARLTDEIVGWIWKQIRWKFEIDSHADNEKSWGKFEGGAEMESGAARWKGNWAISDQIEFWRCESLLRFSTWKLTLKIASLSNKLLKRVWCMHSSDVEVETSLGSFSVLFTRQLHQSLPCQCKQNGIQFFGRTLLRFFLCFWWRHKVPRNPFLTIERD